ncbi:MAG: S4 domain-containing protein YaaA [Erysipelotrichaceae bacterium]|nr:S4 domain-containing protein YaaA [Erysipelotrichaceae bacterium]
MKQIKISTEFVTLGQFLKLANLIQTGGEAKFYLKENKVVVDGEEDNRRGRKLYSGNIVEVENQTFEIVKK